MRRRIRSSCKGGWDVGRHHPVAAWIIGTGLPYTATRGFIQGFIQGFLQGFIQGFLQGFLQGFTRVYEGTCVNERASAHVSTGGNALNPLPFSAPIA
eukprot:1176702-Prorocentrum_minimum.AAC.4